MLQAGVFVTLGVRQGHKMS